MSAEPEVTFDAPVAKKKVVKKSKPRAAAARDTRPSAPFPGMTRRDCAAACYAKKVCAISGSYCAHPCKGGLQAADMNNGALLKKLQDARDQVDVRLDPDRFK
jgi:hypothetical protein